MRALTIGSASIALLAVSISGQTTERVFQFVHTETNQSMQEIATGIRVVGEIPDVSVDAAKKSLTVRGSAEQLGFAGWMFMGLDQTVPVPPDSAVKVYRLTNAEDDIVRLYNIDHGQSMQEFQELATAVRTIGDIRRVYTYNASRTVIVRGNADQIAMADWLFGEIWKHGNIAGTHSSSTEYLMPNLPPPQFNENVLRVFYANKDLNIQEFQSLATLIRTISDIRRVFTYNAPRAMVVRGTSDQITLASSLFDEIDHPASQRPANESALFKFPVAPDGADSARVFYLSSSASTPNLENTLKQIQQQTTIKRVFSYNPARALAMRGTGEQIAAAERLVQKITSNVVPAQ